MLKTIKRVFGEKKPRRKIDGLNLIFPPLSETEKIHTSCLLIYGVLIDLGVLEENHSTYESFSEIFFDSINNREREMLDYFEQIECLDKEYFEDIQVQEAIKVWKAMNLLLPTQTKQVQSSEFMFAVNVIYDTLISKKYAKDDEETYLKVCKSMTTVSKNDQKPYPVLDMLISLPDATTKGTKLYKALKIYVRIVDEQKTIEEEFERDMMYV